MITKYAGETEKNLGLFLFRTKACDVLSLVNEIDALFDSRANVTVTDDQYPFQYCGIDRRRQILEGFMYPNFALNDLL